MCRAVNFLLGVLAEVLVLSVVNGNCQLIFWTFTNPIWLLMINLPNSP